jgi:hypothetical protein
VEAEASMIEAMLATAQANREALGEIGSGGFNLKTQFAGTVAISGELADDMRLAAELWEASLLSAMAREMSDE